MTAAGAGFVGTHRVPAGGLDVWAAPDPSVPAAARLEAGVPVQVRERRGEWAEVVCDNGFTGWLAAGPLEPLATVAPAAAAAATDPARPARPVLPGTPDAGWYASLYESAERGPVASPAALVLGAASSEGADGAGDGEGAAKPASITAIGVGAVLAVIGGFLPWFGFAGVSVSGYEIPLLFVVSKGSFANVGVEGGLLSGGPTIGLACLLAGLAGVLCSRRASTDKFRRLLGWLIVLLPTMAVGQVQLLLREDSVSDVGIAGPSVGVLSVVSIGLAVTIAGGLVLAFAPRARSAPSSVEPPPPVGGPS